MLPAPEIWYHLTILLTLAVAVHFLVTYIGQPMVIFEIMLGIIIGPSVIGIFKGMEETISIFAHLGAVVLLFTIGLECKLHEIYTRKSIAIALGGVIVPWIVGYLFAILIGENFAVAVFLGATLTATSLAATAHILMEFKVLNTSTGKAIMGAAAVDDVLGIIMLAIALSVSAQTVVLLDILQIIIIAAVFVIVGGFFVARYINRVVAFIEAKTKKVEHSGFLFGMVLLFLYAFIADYVHLSSIIGAFVAGTVFATVKIKREFHRGTRYLYTIFAPIFFISVGVMVDVTVFLGSYWWFVLAIVLTGLAVATKVIGCYIPARMFKTPTRDSLVIGMGMAPRCEVALAIAVVGLSHGIISTNIYAIVVFMSIVTTIVAPPMLKMLLRKK
jgi:Kef-type K+ transport system membrane component KefB